MENKVDYRNSIAIIILFLISIFGLHKSSQYYKELKEKEVLINSLNSTTKTWKDKFNKEHTKNDLIETQSINAFLKIKNLQDENKELQNLVLKNKKYLKNEGKAISISNHTKFDTVLKRNSTRLCKNNEGHILSIYTKTNNFELQNKRNLPNYSRNIKSIDSIFLIHNNWIYNNIYSIQDSIHYILEVKNKYSVIIGEEFQGWFKPKKSFVEVINENPYTETKSLKAYSVKNNIKKRNFGLGPLIGYGFDENLDSKFFIGIGLQYNLIKF